MALSPIVYCKSDSAHLCLSCDAKVHSANALSYRHPRTLVCESCRYRPASVRCFDHEMFMCQNCDTSHHRVSFQHRKKAISCYLGCPSAKDLAVLWGFALDELEKQCVGKDQSVCSSLTTADYGHDVNSSVSKMSCSISEGSSSLMADMDGMVSVVYTEFEGGSSSRGTKVVKDNNWQQNSYLILQQIHDLESLQLSDGIVDNSCLVHFKERTGGLPFKHDTMWKFHTNLNNNMESFDPNLDFQQTGNSSLVDKTEEPLSSPFSQLDNFTSTGNSDSFWQYKSPAHNNEVVSYYHISLLDISGPSPVCLLQQSNAADKEMDMSDQVHQLQSINYRPHPIRPSYSASSFSVSRITGESSGSEYKDDELSPTFPKQIIQHGPYDSDDTKSDAKENVIMRYKEKKILR
ncbi:hypothetical protein DH2020_043926 [Rehmannia glutinosa]|uniref:B box-type domain-containing protein n=1 Tax=Rehmannia glutinosa TaxID=99300 RepID=A0ABR0UJX1_REHGL